jgi:hypothetical protein
MLYELADGAAIEDIAPAYEKAQREYEQTGAPNSTKLSYFLPCL